MQKGFTMILTVKDIEKSFGDNHVLKKINLEIESGKALGILGRNGAGKTTTIRIIMGVFDGDEGSILVDDKKIDRNKISIGYLPEERGLYPKKVIIDQLLYFAALKGMTKKDAMKSADYWLERLGMMEYKKRKLETLSKGNQQKIQLVVTLISNPEIVILDEPFSGLDPVNAMLLKDIVKELISDGKIVLFSSHQMNYIEEFCDDIIILNGGEVVVSGTIRDIKRSYERNKILVVSEEAHAIQWFLQCKPSLVEDITAIDENTILLKLPSSNDKEKLLMTLATHQFDIDEFRVYEPSLNDIFVEYTEGKI
ncbi:MAG: ATP-binding cassette domain-containing protein [Eubacteriales bacterium]